MTAWVYDMAYITGENPKVGDEVYYKQRQNVPGTGKQLYSAVVVEVVNQYRHHFTEVSILWEDKALQAGYKNGKYNSIIFSLSRRNGGAGFHSIINPLKGE